MNDTISRQAAIDAIRKGYPDAINSDYKDGLRIGTDRAIYHVEQLPSAQPERDIPLDCIIDEGGNAICPKCGANIEWHKYCEECGQALKWEE